MPFHRSRVVNLRFAMNALRAPLSASPACVTIWPSRRRNICTVERSLLTYWLVQRLGAEHYERYCVTGISSALGAPGGWAVAATIPADIVQYYGYTLRATQKLMYLYGFPEIDSDEEGLQLDSETINEIILCLGAMNGVAGASNAIKGMAKALAAGVEKQLLKMALTKGAFFPFVKSVMRWFGVKLTKTVFAGFFKKAIPLAGGVISGGITFLTFKPCCYRLKNVLQQTALSNPEHVSSEGEDEVFDRIISGKVFDAEFEEVELKAEDFPVEDIDDNPEVE